MIFNENKNPLYGFLFHQKYFLDAPGVILNKNFFKFGEKQTYTRIVFCFEDFISNLFNFTRKKIGSKKTKKLWFQIGKDFGLRYLSYSHFKKRDFENPKKLILNVFDAFRFEGFGSFNFFEGASELFIEGTNLPFMKKFNGSIFFAGILSGIFSYAYGQNFQIECVLIKESHFIFKLKKIRGDFYLPAHIFLGEKTFFYDFPFKSNCCFFKNSVGFSDFIKFKKIKHDVKNNLWSFLGKNLFFCEAGLFGCIFQRYKENNLINFFEEISLFTFEELFRDFFSKCFERKKKINLFLSILSAFGWGIGEIVLCNDFLELNFISPPPFGGDLELRSLFFNSGLNIIFNKNYVLVSGSLKKFVYRIKNCGTTS